MSAGSVAGVQDLVVAEHCINRYRERVGPSTLRTDMAVRRILRAIQSGRIATAREARGIIDYVEHNFAPGSLCFSRKRTRFVLHRGMVYVVQDDQFRPGGLVVITCWPSPLER